MSTFTYHGLGQATSFEECRRLSKEECDMLLRLILGQGSVPIDKFKEACTDQFVCQICIKRIEALGLSLESVAEVETYVMLFSLPEFDRPGAAVMWAFTLIYLAAQAGHPISLSDLCYIYATGFPTPDTMRKCWDAQKIANKEDRDTYGGDNWLDVHSTWLPYVDAVKSFSATTYTQDNAEGQRDDTEATD